MKFAHMSDCHLGSWSNHPDMKEMSLEAFETAINTCIEEGVDFIIIAGDLLDTSLPSIDVLKRAVAKFRECKEAGIPVYMVAGSHDYSPTGKTMLSVFESAGLIKDVAKYEENGSIKLVFTVDKKTDAKITGIFGRKGSLEVDMFRNIDRSIEQEKGFKIFVFHCGIDEHSSMKGMNSVPVSLLPKNFDYYATGHIHIKRVYNIDNSTIAFPGPLFPTSFDELENYDSGFYIVDRDNGKMNIGHRSVKLFGVVLIEKDVTGKTPSEVESNLVDEIESRNLKNSILLLKIYGLLRGGKPSDIDFKSITSRAESLGAICVKKNVSKLTSEMMEDMKIESITNIDDLERHIVSEHANRMQIAGRKNMERLILDLMNAMKEEKGEDETNATFEEKIKENTKRLLGL